MFKLSERVRKKLLEDPQSRELVPVLNDTEQFHEVFLTFLRLVQHEGSTSLYSMLKSSSRG